MTKTLISIEIIITTVALDTTVCVFALGDISAGGGGAVAVSLAAAAASH